MTVVELPPEVAAIPGTLDRMATALERLAAAQRPATGLASVAEARADLAAAWDAHVAASDCRGNGCTPVNAPAPTFTAREVRDFLLGCAPAPTRCVELGGHAYNDLGFPDVLVLQHHGDDGATRLGFDFGAAGRIAVALDFTQAAQLATAMTRRS